MPIFHTVDHRRRRINSHATDLVTIEILLAHMRSRLDPAIADYAEVLDLTGQSTDITEAQMHMLADERKRIAVNIKAGPTAVVATDNVFFGMFRMFDILTDEVRPMRVFREADEAEKWLDEIEADLRKLQ